MSPDQMEHLNIQVIQGRLTSELIKKEIVSLCNRAYEEDMGTLFETFVDPTHVLGYYNDLMVCHALWVTRYLQVGTNTVMRTAYVEAVATESKYRKRGFAASIMRHVAGEIQDYELAALSPLVLNTMNDLDGNFGVVRYS